MAARRRPAPSPPGPCPPTRRHRRQAVSLEGEIPQAQRGEQAAHPGSQWQRHHLVGVVCVSVCGGERGVEWVRGVGGGATLSSTATMYDRAGQKLGLFEGPATAPMPVLRGLDRQPRRLHLVHRIGASAVLRRPSNRAATSGGAHRQRGVPLRLKVVPQHLLKPGAGRRADSGDRRQPE